MATIDGARALTTVKRLAWFVGLWLAGVAVLGVFAWIIRWSLGL